MEKFRISVRSLVEFLLHSGDIDGGKGGMADKEAMQLGSRIHRKIQGSMGAGYRPEVSLKAEIVKETFTLFVEGAQEEREIRYCRCCRKLYVLCRWRAWCRSLLRRHD